MKVVFINIVDSEKIKVRSLKFMDDVNENLLNFKEVLIPLTAINKRIFEYSNSILGKLKSVLLDRKIMKEIGKNGYNTYYVLCSTVENAQCRTALSEIKIYLESMLELYNYIKFEYKGNIKSNIDKYMLDFMNKHNMEAIESRLLMIYSDCNNIDYSIIGEMIQKHKAIDIYCKTCDMRTKNQKLVEINNKYGSSIEIKTRISKKQLKDYDSYIYMDSSKTDINPPASLRVYLNNDDEDRYDKYFEKYINSRLDKKLNKEYVSYAFKNYGKLKTICLLYKSMNINEK